LEHPVSSEYHKGECVLRPLAYVAAIAKRASATYVVSLLYGAHSSEVPQWCIQANLITHGRIITRNLPDAKEDTITRYAFEVGETIKQLYPAAFGRTRDEEIYTIDNFGTEANRSLSL
jgi:hypothetical protein